MTCKDQSEYEAKSKWPLVFETFGLVRDLAISNKCEVKKKNLLKPWCFIQYMSLNCKKNPQRSFGSSEGLLRSD